MVYLGFSDGLLVFTYGLLETNETPRVKIPSEESWKSGKKTLESKVSRAEI